MPRVSIPQNRANRPKKQEAKEMATIILLKPCFSQWEKLHGGIQQISRIVQEEGKLVSREPEIIPLLVEDMGDVAFRPTTLSEQTKAKLRQHPSVWLIIEAEPLKDGS